MSISVVILFLLVSFPTKASEVFKKRADLEARSAVSAERVAYMKPVETPLADIKKYFSSLEKTRELNETEKKIGPLLNIAETMTIDKITSYHLDPVHLTPQNVLNSMILEMQKNPTWDKQLPAANVVKLKEQAALLKTLFTEKTYAWAWFQKQFGESQLAKQILQNLFNEGYQNGVRMSHRGFGYTNPLTELGFIQAALGPISSTQEKTDMNEKVQKVKTIYSNLPPSNIQT